MKKIINYIPLLSLMIVLLFSCEEVLEVELDDEIRTTEAITDIISLRSAVTGLYDVLQSGSYYGGEFILAQALTGGIADATGFQESYAQLDNAIVPTSSTYLESNWVDVYATVNASNLILDKIVELDLEDPESEGAALFFRALGTFDALRQFGQFTDTSSDFGVPISTYFLDSETALTVERSSVAASYDQIISDLNDAIDLLGFDDNKLLVSRGTAEALLARVYLYQGDYMMAEQLATDVINNNDYELNTDYNDIYDEEQSLEAIFELQFLATDGNNLTSLLSASPPEVSANFSDFFDVMDADNDPRSFRYFDDGRIVFVDKYGTSNTDLEGNAILLKLSEMYLIRAEARARLTPEDLTNALEDLNVVRTRSLSSQPIEAIDVPDFDSFVDVLLEERSRELAFEGHRWFDIVRLGQAESILGIASFRTVYPIPQREITISNGSIVQNPGY
ncbi:RagB/SusD family nutrient uptake outer membrane protein [uncultured Aquimarina sp.]|uniref:RagB/SusD family nutrient uptake outer membrane protein n=1 Tax=uncultured Aquimarina sp. TaxID=575652 RepID=UPI002629DB5F|nr:RagB/SusD family nutrient uptake outer membrane protein [uncultured Aquimarina sp.]